MSLKISESPRRAKSKRRYQSRQKAMTRSVVVPLAVSLMMIASVSGLPEEVFGDLDKELKSCPKEYPKCKYTGQCCPKNFVCGPNACCDPGTVTCPHNTCCDAGYHCCPQSGSWSGCCPNGQKCVQTWCEGVNGEISAMVWKNASAGTMPA